MKYRIKPRAPQHYVGGRLYEPGEIVEYPDDMKPGMWLEPIEEPIETPEPNRRGRSRKEATT